jgi:hypothetical protein
MKTKTVSPRLLAMEAAGGAVGGLLLAIPGTLLGRTLGAAAGNGFGDLVGAVLLAAVGYLAGAALGVYWMGRRAGRPGALWAIALGGLAGGALVLGLATLGLAVYPTLLQIAFLAGIPALAVAGAQLTRRA